MPLPPKQANMALFPNGCPVQICAINPTARSTSERDPTDCQFGHVKQVGIDLTSPRRNNCYKVMIGNKVRIFEEDALQFAPRAPVWLTLPDGLPKTEVEGVVVSSADMLSDTNTVCYTVRLIADGKKTFYLDICPKTLRFRSQKNEVEKDWDNNDKAPPVATVVINPSPSVTSEAASEFSDSIQMPSSPCPDFRQPPSTDITLHTPCATPPRKTRAAQRSLRQAPGATPTQRTADSGASVPYENASPPTTSSSLQPRKRSASSLQFSPNTQSMGDLGSPEGPSATSTTGPSAASRTWAAFPTCCS